MYASWSTNNFSFSKYTFCVNSEAFCYCYLHEGHYFFSSVRLWLVSKITQKLPKGLSLNLIGGWVPAQNRPR